MKSSTLVMFGLSISALGEPTGLAGAQAMRRTPLSRGDTAMMIRSSTVATSLASAAPFRRVEGPLAGNSRRRVVSGIVGGVIGGAVGFVGSGVIIFSHYSCADPNPLPAGQSPCKPRGMNVVIPVVIIGGTAAGAAFGAWIGRHLND